MPRRDDGQAAVLMLAVVALAAMLLTAAGHLGTRVVHRSQAQAAADAAALAGVTDGESAAREVARLNEGQLREFLVIDEWTIEVLVTVGREGAVARATRAP